MRKVQAFATVKNNKLYGISVITKTGITYLLCNDTGSMVLAYQYNNLQEIITSILNILDNNNMYVDYSISFGRIFPDIFITNLDYFGDNPELALPEQYGYLPIKYRQAGLNKRGEKFCIADGKVIGQEWR